MTASHKEEKVGKTKEADSSHSKMYRSSRSWSNPQYKSEFKNHANAGPWPQHSTANVSNPSQQAVAVTASLASDVTATQ